MYIKIHSDNTESTNKICEAIKVILPNYVYEPEEDYPDIFLE